ncbi:glycosyltransferase [Vibrio algarum]|uniref:Glycosyltransferase n=1 Tax=Vibrio algarum TaxID=3020714 RepID=A0ABT4YVX0_9VIBR|nr:glycosyltransferase [Vibrio sp. KJ40-1]MDB1125724.1 glycosyltransferase [Vibrio sp. KJ40-1]
MRFWIKQLYFALMLMMTLLRIHPVNSVVGMSGPGIDMALYLIKPFYHFKLIQLIHGPVGCSRSIGYCLVKADLIFALESAHPSINAAFIHYFSWKVNTESATEFAQFTLSTPRYLFFTNGISHHHWPTSCTYGEPRLFWSASLLKWKGLDTLIDAGKHLAESTPIPTDICYIKPERTALSISQAPVDLPCFTWHQNPRNLDEVRSQNNIFASTSQNEPFGLSILEAMAAGMCVLIPRDGAYWDRILTHNVDCIKYQPNNSKDLFLSIKKLIHSPELIPMLGQKAKKVAENYHAETSYREIVYAISHPYSRAVRSD